MPRTPSKKKKKAKDATKEANENFFDAHLGWKKGNEDIAARGDAATEPPYSDAELERTLDVASVIYGPTGAHARGVKIHSGPLKLRAAKKPPYRTGWVHSDKQYDPYITFSEVKPEEKKSGAPPKLWFPKELHEPKTKDDKNSGPKLAYTDDDLKVSHRALAGRPRWDTEHHIMISQANSEVQKFVREYFDKPMRKESEGIPKVRELYSMNDRQCGWWDEASPLGMAKHTYLDNVGPWNVGGPQSQKPSYWRKIAERGTASMPTLGEKQSLSEAGRYIVKVPEGTKKLGFTPVALPPQPVKIMHVEPESWAEMRNVSIGDELLEIDDAPVAKMTRQEFIDAVKAGKQFTFYRSSHLSLTQRLANMPAAQSTQFWRDWVDLSSKRLPPPPEQPKNSKKKGGRLADPSGWGSSSKRGGWPTPSESPRDAQTATAVNPTGATGSGATLKKDKDEKEPWNERWSVCASKDNPVCCQGHRQFFSSAQFLSGAEVGHPGALLGLQSQKWRATAKNVTLSPSGPSGRGSHGRRCLLV